MQKGIYGFVWHYSKRQQLIATLITIASFPFLYASLELPKDIVNNALDVDNQVQKLLWIDIEGILGFDLDRPRYLILLCLILLTLLAINALFLMALNTYKNLTSERMTRRLRYLLYQRILRFPLPHFQRVSQSELSTMIAGEVELVREFIADAISLPMFQGGQLVVILLFMFNQDPILGVAAIALIPVQAYVIPILQRKINLLNKERTARARKLSARVGETVSGIRDIRTNDTVLYSQADFSKHLEGIFKVRYRLFRTKYFMKALNVFLLRLTPLLFYLVGGLLIIWNPEQPAITIGQLVAAIAAYSSLTSPWKELLKYYQRRGDAQIKYQQLFVNFELENLLNEKILASDDREPESLEGSLAFENVTVQDDDGSKPLDGVSFAIGQGKSLAVVGGATGRDRLAHVTTRLLAPSAGKILIGHKPLSSLSAKTVAANIGYVGADSYVFEGTVGYNATYGLQRRIPREAGDYDRDEALASGNCPFDVRQDWTELSAAGCEDAAALEARWYEIIHAVELDDIIFHRALSACVDPRTSPLLADKILDARQRIAAKLDADPELGQLVRRFEFDAYNVSATVGENLIFGEPADRRLAFENFGANPFVRGILTETGLDERFQAIGFDVARELVDMFGHRDGDHDLLDQFSFVDGATLDRLRLVVAASEGDHGALGAQAQSDLIALTARLSVERHRLGDIDKALEAKIVAARKLFHERLPDELRDAVAVYDPKAFNPRLSLGRNLVMGRRNLQLPNAEQNLNAIIRDVVTEMDMFRDIVIAGMQVETGIGGQSLAMAARQSLTLARAVLKRPAVLVVNDALNAHDRESRERIRSRSKALVPETTLIWIDSERPRREDFDMVFELRDGHMTEYVVEPEAAPAEPSVAVEAETPQAIRAEAAALAKVPLFKEMRSNNLKLLAFGSKRVTFRPGEIMLRRGDIADTAYVVLSGEVEILLNAGESNERQLAMVGRYGPVGEISLLATAPRTVTARAFTTVEALEINKQLFLQILRSDAHMAANAARISSERLADVLERMQEAA